MQLSTFKRIAIVLLSVMLATGCATQQKNIDYTAFKQSRPGTILVLPPLNNSLDAAATYGMLSQVTYPLAESGYYVLPVALVDETFKQNGLTAPGDIHGVAPAKLREIFGADAVLYMNVQKYGSSYTVLDSITTVTAEARLVDLKNGALLWEGSATASNNGNSNNQAGGLIGILVSAIVNQIIATNTDVSHDMAGFASARLLMAGHENSMLYGPRSPKYGTD